MLIKHNHIGTVKPLANKAPINLAQQSAILEIRQIHETFLRALDVPLGEGPGVEAEDVQGVLELEEKLCCEI